ncbi:MAG: 2,3-bisphosphoglycerate-independent phosphoglycerate mutase [Gemmatimonadota bacterium]
MIRITYGGGVQLEDIRDSIVPGGEPILLLVLDGVGGLPRERGGPTELEAARTPNLDALAASGDLGLHWPVGPAVTPGSGPGHLSLFGYEPSRYRIGRGVLEALGVEFDLRPGDIAARGNLCTVDSDGIVSDRRAGRISTERAVPACEALDAIEVPGARVFVRVVKEHRFLMVVRMDEPSAAAIEDTDPGRVGAAPGPVVAETEASEPAAGVVRSWLERAPEALVGHAPANMVLLRGFSTLPEWPRFPDVYGLRSLAVAAYPMYRGVARLVGMDAAAVPEGPRHLLETARTHGADRDYLFLHVKAPDRMGEDGNFDGKVAAIEEADAIVPELLEAFPGVWIVTGDHSTPATMGRHSWHPVPVLLHGGPGRGEPPDATFDERACAAGSLGRVPGCELMPLAMARAGRLGKFGA